MPLWPGGTLLDPPGHAIPGISFPVTYIPLTCLFVFQIRPILDVEEVSYRHGFILILPETRPTLQDVHPCIRMDSKVRQEIALRDLQDPRPTVPRAGYRTTDLIPIVVQRQFE